MPSATRVTIFSAPCFNGVICRQDGVGGAAWVCTVLRGMDLPCYTHTFYEVPEARSGLRERYMLKNAAKRGERWLLRVGRQSGTN